MTFSITTPSIGSFYMTLSITMLFYFAECHNAEFHILFTIMLNVIVLSVVMMSVVMLIVVVPFNLL
jgi:hypothetical protein